MTAVEEIRAGSYVGFDSITQQIEHKLLKRGFQFNVIVVGAYACPFINVSFCRNLLGWTWGDRTNRTWKVDLD